MSENNKFIPNISEISNLIKTSNTMKHIIKVK